MCGIALILAGVRIIRADVHGESIDDPAADAAAVDAADVHGESIDDPAADAAAVDAAEACPDVQMDDLKASLLRRGPDNLDSRKLYIHLNPGSSVKKTNLCTQHEKRVLLDGEEDKEKDKCLCFTEIEKGCLVTSQDVSAIRKKSAAELDLIGATLQLRGRSPVSQPMEDKSGNILVYNGEIFGGIPVDEDSNDAEELLDALEGSSCDCLERTMICSCVGHHGKSVPQILSTIRGPWALIYWQELTKTIWFGRDTYGRRSLLVHWPTYDDSRFILSSVSPSKFARKDSNMDHTDDYWEELPCGMYSVHLKASKINEQFGKNHLVGEERKHEWTDPLLNKLISWERKFIDPKAEETLVRDLPSQNGESALLPCLKGKSYKIGDSGDHIIVQAKSQEDTTGSARSDLIQLGHVIEYTHSAQKVLVALTKSVKRRTTLSGTFQMALHQTKETEPAPVALLFSGGLDSMILAALLDQCLDPNYTIDLLNVSFDGHLAPDRISARLGLRELQRVAPHRRWRLVEIDANLPNLTWETNHLMSLIHPAKTYMDLNIGLALWLAAGGDGWINEEISQFPLQYGGHYQYKSTARILLVGSGADEQCAGYGRHRTKYRLGSWVALQEEMRLDMQRMWKRNLGRDDRCISDHGKEARFPFLDEDVIRTLLELPLWEIAELDEPSGRGDKKILREVARLLGLQGAAVLPKRAIQFGSRIARESNLKNFGSNRAANQASAGSVEIHS